MPELIVPIDVATVETSNSSINLVLLFPDERQATLYMDKVVKVNNFEVIVHKDEINGYKFELVVPNSRYSSIIQTKRTIKNNESLSKLSNTSFKGYYYLSTGFLSKQKGLMFDPNNSVPVSLKVL